MATTDDFRLYSKRWHMLVLYATSSLLNAVLWISFASIDDATAAFYHVTVEQVNWLAIVFQVLYFPGMIFALYLMAATSVRHTLVVGTGMSFMGGLLRALSAFVAPSDPQLGYALCMAGQVIGALCQPVFLSTPAVVAANWFPVSERDLATTIGALFNPLGNAVGQVIPPFVVVETGSDDGRDDDDGIDASSVAPGMQRLLVGQAAALGLSFLWTFACFRSHPPSPPSASAEKRWKAAAKAKAARRATRDSHGGAPAAGSGGLGSVSALDSVEEHKRAVAAGDGGLASAAAAADENHDDDDDDDDGDDDPGQVVAVLLAQFRVLLKDKNFLLLLGAFSIGLAVFNALLTVINQLLEPYGFSNDEAGLAGGMLILAGLVGAAITAVLMDSFHCYREVLKGAFTLAFLALNFVFLVLSQGWSYGALLAAFAAMGLFTLPVLPGVIENAVEATYPIPEEASSGLLFCSGNVLGIAFTEILAKLVKSNETDDDDKSGSGPRAYFTPTSVFLLGTITLCVLLVLPYNGQYKRLAAEKQGGSDNDGGRPDASDQDSGLADALQAPLLGMLGEDQPPRSKDGFQGSPSKSPPSEAGSSNIDVEV